MTIAPHLHATSADGTAIAAWRSGTGPNLLLVHGTTADHSRWARLIPLWESEFTVWTIDRRGRGGSGDAATYSVEREGADICAVAEAIGGPVGVLGHSYGAICALEAALRCSSIRRLALYEPPLPVGEPIVDPAIRDTLDQMVARGEREAALTTFFSRVVRLPDEQIEMLRAGSSWESRVAAAHTIPRELRLEAGYRLEPDRLRSMRVPTLLLLGGESAPFFGAAIRELHRLLPDSRLLEIPGQQHVAMDSAPEEFARLTGEFFRGG
jgi:pimeloyl-ACP methyl ester carboxylesterase